MRNALIVSGLSLALTSGAFAQETDSWSPSNYDDLEKSIVDSSNAKGEPVIGFTVRPDSFEKDVSDGFVSYATLIRTPFSIEGAPDGLQEIFLRSEFFRDQKATGGEEYSFRSVQSALVVNCASREITENGFTRFEENETNGRAVYFVEGTTIYAEMAMASPSAGSMFESAMNI